MNKTLLKLAFRGLIRNRRRTFLTIAAFIVGFMGLYILSGYILRIERVLRTSTVYFQVNGHIKIQKTGSAQYWNNPKKYIISAEQSAKLEKRLPEVLGEDLDFLSQKLRAAALLTLGTKSVPIFLTGIPIEAERRARTHPRFSKWFETFFMFKATPFKSIKPGIYGVSITPNIARKFGFKVYTEKDPIFFDAQIVGLDFASSLNAIDVSVNKLHIDGSDFLKELSVEAPIGDVRNFTQTEGSSEFNIILKDESHLQLNLKKVQSLLYGDLGDLEAKPFNDESVGPEYVGNMGILNVIMFFFILIIGGSVILSVLNVLTMSIKERSLEIGTLLSLGYRPLTIQQIFICESLFIGLIGTLIGYPLSLLTGQAIEAAKLTFEPPGAVAAAIIRIDLTVGYAIFLVSLLLGLLLIATFQLSRKQTSKKLVHLLYTVEAYS